MRRGRSFLIFGVLLYVPGCNSQDVLAPPVGLSSAAATRSCGPADGPAVALYLASAPISSVEPAIPYIRVNLWKPADALVGTWSVSPASADGSAASFPALPGSIENAASGTVVVISVGGDSTITGNVDLQFPVTGHVRGNFSAHWIPRTVLCG